MRSSPRTELSASGLRDFFEVAEPMQLANLLAQAVAQHTSNEHREELSAVIGGLLHDDKIAEVVDTPSAIKRGILMQAEASLSFVGAEARRARRLTLRDRILDALADEPMTTTNLAQFLETDISQISRAIRPLEEAGYVCREALRADGRSFLLRLTNHT